ncbi:MAG TPA: glycosyltransferase [Propionibacteriaceae bacterium]|nr:glycosyltransferase [Propionibacteriaceae bacterium]
MSSDAAPPRAAAPPRSAAPRAPLADRWRQLGLPEGSNEWDLEAVEPSAGSFTEVDPWGWLAPEDGDGEAVDTSSCSVTAVLVTRDAARWLPETLAGLAALSRRPTRLVALDAASSDETPQLLEDARSAGVLDAVYVDAAACGFGAAVSSALSHDRDWDGEGERDSGDPDWLWLLHDDAVPAPDALERLLTHVVLDPALDVTGPKLLLPSRPRTAGQISEIGVTISGTGRREVLLDAGEIDQGQRDHPRRTLGVSTCGMLVRRAVWHQLGGLDPDVPVFRDGVDFGWRAHLAGFSVVTTPRAEFVHRHVSRAGLRPSGAGGRRPEVTDRYLGMLVVAGHASRLGLGLVWLRLVWGCLLRAVGYLFGKAPARSVDELLGLARFVGRPGRLFAVRGRVARLSRAPGTRKVVRGLRPRWGAGLRVAAEAISAAMVDRYRSVAGELESSSLDELTGDDFSAAAADKPQPWLTPIVVVALLSVLGCLVAARSLLTAGSLVAPTLLPAPSSLTELWRSVWQPIYGAPEQIGPPWLAVVAVGSTVLAGRPELLVTLLLCGVVPLSLVAVYPVVRRAVSGRRMRLWVAVTYALLPVLLGGTNQGRLSLCVMAIGLPLLVLAARALVLRRPRTPEAWRGGWGAGAVLVVLGAFEPSLILFAGVLGLLGVVWVRRSPRKIGRIGIALLVPLAVLAPWWPSLIATPGRLFTGPDAALGGVDAAPQWWQLLLGRVGGGGLPPLWLGAVVFGTIWVVALYGLGRRPRSRALLVSWVVAVLALAAAIALSRLVVSVPPLATEVRPWVGVYELIGFAALVLAGGIGADGLAGDLARRSFGWLQPAFLGAGTLVGLVSVLAAGWWLWAGAAGPIQRDRLDALPAYVVDELRSPAAVRVLAINLESEQIRYAVVSDDQIRLGDADRGFAFGGSTAARTEVTDLVVRLVAGTADSDLTPDLANLGVGLIWVTGATKDDLARIDNTPGLGSASGNDRSTVWQLVPDVSRATVVERDRRRPVGPPPVALPPGAGDRLLRLGEPADPRWQAHLNGMRLSPVTDGWQQAFVVPATGGSLTYAMPTSTRWMLLIQGVLLLVTAVLAAPGIRRPEVRDPARSARRASGLGGVLR